jgi:hypothetical protein
MNNEQLLINGLKYHKELKKDNQQVISIQVKGINNCFLLLNIHTESRIFEGWVDQISGETSPYWLEKEIYNHVNKLVEYSNDYRDDLLRNIKLCNKITQKDYEEIYNTKSNVVAITRLQNHDKKLAQQILKKTRKRISMLSR